MDKKVEQKIRVKILQTYGDHCSECEAGPYVREVEHGWHEVTEQEYQDLRYYIDKQNNKKVKRGRYGYSHAITERLILIVEAEDVYDEPILAHSIAEAKKFRAKEEAAEAARKAAAKKRKETLAKKKEEKEKAQLEKLKKKYE